MATDGAIVPSGAVEVIDRDDAWHCRSIRPCGWTGPRRDLVMQGDCTACPQCRSVAVFEVDHDARRRALAQAVVDLYRSEADIGAIIDAVRALAEAMP